MNDPVILGVWCLLAGAALALLVLVVPARRWRRRVFAPVGDSAAMERIDVAAMGRQPTTTDSPYLEVYGTPVHLHVLILAPVGRHGTLPPKSELPAVVDQLLPGLMQVVNRCQPLYRGWPPQLSVFGFTQSFFNRVPLPANRGKGSPWCSLAGRFETGDLSYVAGLVCAADNDNALGQIVVEHEGQWLDIVRVRQGRPSLDYS